MNQGEHGQEARELLRQDDQEAAGGGNSLIAAELLLRSVAVALTPLWVQGTAHN